jgi:response regulator RpfG family c-di-GMP phosphodiesterase
MPGDPAECREHAARCAEMAVTAATPELKATLAELSQIWEHLAFSLERILELLDESEVAQLEVHQPRERTDQLSDQLGKMGS